MKWEGNRESDNVEDRRGADGGGGGFGIGGRSIGIGTIAIALVASYFFGVDPRTVIGLLNGGGPAPQTTQTAPPPNPQTEDRETRFVRTVLADTEDTWSAIFQKAGQNYVKPRLVIFSGRTPTACGTGQTATGPFYCPGDQKIYIDLNFFRLMQQRFHVSGEFAQAYVIAHEVGHHVQTLMGIMNRVDATRQRASEREANALSVRVELQADCFAGVWAKNADRARSILEQGDVETALNAATAIGDDALQKQAQGYVVPDSFTHGTSAQRVRWFRRGLESGQVNACNTFEATSL
ncbi:KPN_02809 family neutral zinc metallopeptidase [Noviherbaspirillum pedocola]|uniref:Neutral zinc metallopeptidase n=1 Tax=Noviherbaspirillum pedocola TaxID=2801341 RepID=A0A934SXB2_9BURK|nr:neutral zinc metallopeptidase [Noviherbaspirillum pedocola]MBK4738556.1 neutral zinc metallopeptidase [Noviherbaspirillum pedocola]